MKIIKISSSQGSLGENIGTEEAPNEIIKHLNKKCYFEDVKIVGGNIDETNKNIFNKAKLLVDENVVFVGGDHSVTYPVFKAFARKYKNPGLVIFDAHPDCQSDFYISHEDVITSLIKERLVRPQNIILIGIRKWSKEEFEFLRANNIRFFTAEQLSTNFVENCDVIIGMSRNFDKLYLSIDIDVIDPAFAPGTGYIEPIGLHPREIFFLLKRFKRLENLKWVDLVEVNPKKDFNNMTVKLAARLLDELVS
ncbi:MAG: arginase family protein [Nanoarchaeota archaeon]